MIDERGLLGAMKSTWRSEGYTVAGYREDGERVLCIHGASWLAAIPYSAIGRKVLALLVEHLGEIPDGAERPATLKVTAYDPELVRIGDGEPMGCGEMLVWNDEGGLVVVLQGREIIGEELAAVLEQTPLV